MKTALLVCTNILIILIFTEAKRAKLLTDSKPIHFKAINILIAKPREIVNQVVIGRNE
jgi:hypothetical protein